MQKRESSSITGLTRCLKWRYSMNEERGLSILRTLTWLMNFGGDIKIIAPESVAAQQIELAKKVIAAYE